MKYPFPSTSLTLNKVCQSRQEIKCPSLENNFAALQGELNCMQFTLNMPKSFAVFSNGRWNSSNSSGSISLFFRNAWTEFHCPFFGSTLDHYHL